MRGRIISSSLAVGLLIGCGTGSSPEIVAENVLGTLVECDHVIEEVVGYSGPNPEDEIVRRHKVAVIPVADPNGVSIIRCGGYRAQDGGSREDTSSSSGADCHVSGSWVIDGVTTFTPSFEVYVECEEEEIWPDGRTEIWGNDRVYLRTDPSRSALWPQNPLGVAVECDQVIEEVEERYFGEGDARERLEKVTRRNVAYVPVSDPTSVTVTRCGQYSTFDNGDEVFRDSSEPNCVANLSAIVTEDSHVVVDCGEERTYPVGWSTINGGRGAAVVIGWEHVYVRQGPEIAATSAENPFGELVQCDEVLEGETSAGSAYRNQVAFLPVADPTRVTLTYCGVYEAGSSDPDQCSARKGVAFTPDLEVYVRCESELTTQQGTVITSGYERVYFREE
jgi:hypothetical protein